MPTFGFRIYTLQSKESKTSGAKILFRTDCRKYKNFNESRYFSNNPYKILYYVIVDLSTSYRVYILQYMTSAPY